LGNKRKRVILAIMRMMRVFNHRRRNPSRRKSTKPNNRERRKMTMYIITNMAVINIRIHMTLMKILMTTNIIITIVKSINQRRCITIWMNMINKREAVIE